MNPYLCSTEEEQKTLLASIGAESVEDLFSCIPADLRRESFPEMAPAIGEFELASEMRRLAAKNRYGEDVICFSGGGAYEHFIPAVVPALSRRTEFVTAYTPYQAEVSQGSLQAFFEYQSLICRLFEMDIANASMYDGATALAEGVIMAADARPGRRRCLVAETLHPFWRDVLSTYVKHLNIELVTLKSAGGVVPPEVVDDALDDSTACVVFQHPNFFGCLEDMEIISQKTHEKGALFIVAADPISSGILSPPGAYDADVAVAEGQPLGMPAYFGGETLGIFTCKKELMRKMPGRLVGMTKDSKGRRGFVLTLQTREQHIRREKATSNICTNHALNALKAAIYLSTLGPQGLSEAANTCYANAEYTKSQIRELGGYSIPFDAPTFKEFVVRAEGSGEEITGQLARRGILVGPWLGHFNKAWAEYFIVCVTETRTRQDIDNLVYALKTRPKKLV